MEQQSQNPIVPTSKILTDEKPNFFIQQFYTSCIAEAAYYIESEGKAIIIDPLRDTYPYVQLAKQRNAKITHILLTHFHADFVSGHLDLQKSQGAEIVYGPTAAPSFKAHIAKDQEKIQLGKIEIQVLHTPGHTMESSTYLLLDEGKPYSIFTGDTLFLGEVGRPDLAVKGADLTQEDLAGHLFDSLNNVIKALPDNVIVYPGHGAGSACGKNIQQGTSDTLENQKKTNYALKITDRNEFIKTLTANLPTPPNYFFHDVGLNKNGYENLDNLIQKNKTPLDVKTFQKLVEEGHQIIDSRDKFEYLKGFIIGSISVDLKASFASWVGKLMKATDKFVIITPKGEEYQTIVRMCRVGFDNCSGYLEGGFESWQNANLKFAQATAVDISEFEKIYENKSENEYFIDVRDDNEKFKGDLAKFDQQVGLWGILPKFQADKDLIKGRGKNIYCVCQSGQRSVPFISILANNGYTNLYHVTGGMNAIKESKIPVVYP